MRSALIPFAFGLALLLGCEVQPCDRFVDYICSCHDGEEGFDCEAEQQALSGAGPAVQDQCSIDLAELIDEDEANGVVCDVP